MWIRRRTFVHELCVLKDAGNLPNEMGMSDAASQANILNPLKAICQCVQVSLLKQDLLKFG